MLSQATWKVKATLEGISEVHGLLGPLSSWLLGPAYCSLTAAGFPLMSPRNPSLSAHPVSLHLLCQQPQWICLHPLTCDPSESPVCLTEWQQAITSTCFFLPSQNGNFNRKYPRCIPNLAKMEKNLKVILPHGTSQTLWSLKYKGWASSDPADKGNRNGIMVEGWQVVTNSSGRKSHSPCWGIPKTYRTTLFFCFHPKI